MANGRASYGERLATSVTAYAGGNRGFLTAFAIVLLWLATGPFMRYSEGWQLTINTTTTIITFLMVFLIQRSQAKESKAVQLKLNEIVAALEGASNRMISIENLDESELDEMGERFHALLQAAKRGHATGSLSIENPPAAGSARAVEKG